MPGNVFAPRRIADHVVQFERIGAEIEKRLLVRTGEDKFETVGADHAVAGADSPLRRTDALADHVVAHGSGRRREDRAERFAHQLRRRRHAGEVEQRRVNIER